MWKRAGFFTISLVAVGFGLLGGVALADQPATAQSREKLSNADRNFAMDAARANVLEIEMGKLTEQHGASDEVKQFGKRMVTDHTKAQDELKDWAAKNDVLLPIEASAKALKEKDQLAKYTGADFDKRFAKDMAKDHDHVVSMFKLEADHGTNPDLKVWSGKTLATLQEHQQLAHKLETNVKSDAH